MFDVKTLNLDDILVYDNGYSMVLPHFLKVIRFSPSMKTVYVRELEAKIVNPDPYGQSGYKIPSDRFAPGKEEAIRISPKKDYLTYKGHYCRVWDGKPETWDTYD